MPAPDRRHSLREMLSPGDMDVLAYGLHCTEGLMVSRMMFSFDSQQSCYCLHYGDGTAPILSFHDAVVKTLYANGYLSPSRSTSIMAKSETMLDGMLRTLDYDPSASFVPTRLMEAELNGLMIARKLRTL